MSADLPQPDYARNLRLVGWCDQGGRPEGVQIMVHRLAAGVAGSARAPIRSSMLSEAAVARSSVHSAFCSVSESGMPGGLKDQART